MMQLDPVVVEQPMECSTGRECQPPLMEGHERDHVAVGDVSYSDGGGDRREQGGQRQRYELMKSINIERLTSGFIGTEETRGHTLALISCPVTTPLHRTSARNRATKTVTRS